MLPCHETRVARLSKTRADVPSARARPEGGKTMSAIAVYTLDEFVTDLQQAFASHDDLVGRANAVAEVLQHLLQVGGWVQELLDKGGYEALPGSTYTDASYGHPAA